LREAANVEPLFVGRATAKTLEVWGVRFLDTFFSHADCSPSLDDFLL
jgi:hypothetical protein